MISENEVDGDGEADCANGEGDRVANGEAKSEGDRVADGEGDRVAIGEGDRVADGEAKSEGDDVSCVASLDRLTAVFILPF